MRPSLPLLALTLVFSLSCSKPDPNQGGNNSTVATTTAPANTESGTDENLAVVLNIPVGEAGVSYANTDTPESEPWGPSALRIAPDGTFLIVDTVTNSILRFRGDGTQVPRITVDNVVGITDVAADDSNIYVLDEAAPAPAIVRLTTDGKVQERRSISPGLVGQGLSGLTLSDNGTVLLEFEGGSQTRGPDGRPALDKALRGRAYSVKVPPLSSQALEGVRGVLSTGNQPAVEVKTDNLLAGMKVLESNADGGLSLLVEEIAATPQVFVDETIRRFDASGKQIGIARVPISKRYTHVEHHVALGRDNQVFALVTYPDHAAVVRLNFTDQLKPILPKSSFHADNATPTVNCNQTRAQITERAKEFANNKTMLNATNLDGDCPGRTKPRYLGSVPAQYDAVPYDWGGWDTVASFNQLMAQNKVAGDIQTAGVEDCSRGVDCSGFVTRCWGITNKKYGTATLPEISDEINIVNLLPGDILNFSGKHVILFDRFAHATDGGNGVMAFESTPTNKVDRVLYRRSGWQRLAGYIARRYMQVCQ